MEREGDRHPGTMRAILGLSIEQVEELLASSGDDEVVIANHNSAQQVVVSGSHDGLARFSPQAQEVGGKVIALNVTVANHSPLVAGAVDDFCPGARKAVGFNPPTMDVYLNVTAERCEEPDLIRDIMARQIVFTGPMVRDHKQLCWRMVSIPLSRWGPKKVSGLHDEKNRP
jgi:[acyl-carrier-protein] S-malonyltransferase